MVKELKSESVIVTRDDGIPQQARTLHEFHQEFKNDQGQVVRTELAGVAVELAEKKQVVYAQYSQIAAA